MKQIFLLIFTLSTLSLFAQQDLYSWRVSVHGGGMTYYGDLSNSYLDVQSPWLDVVNQYEETTYGLSVENFFSKTMSWRLSGMRGSFQANDRAIDWNGDILTDAANFDRSLNVRTSITNLMYSFNFYADNNGFLSQKARISPYIGVGVGVTWFTPYADLFDGNGGRYSYWSDNTIRNGSEMNVPNATIINQDGNFETNLREVKTELQDYNEFTLSIPVNLGLKFRLTDRINVNIEATGIYTFTDYLDDVSGEFPTNYDNPLQAYASNPNSQNQNWRGTQDDLLNDIYGTLTLGVSYNFGYKMESFLPPVFYSKDATLRNGKVVENKTDVPTLPKEKVVDAVEEKEVVKIDTVITITEDEKGKKVEEEVIVIKETVEEKVVEEKPVEKEEQKGIEVISLEENSTVTLPDTVYVEKSDKNVVVKEPETAVEVVEIPAENGQLVGADTPAVKIETAPVIAAIDSAASPIEEVAIDTPAVEKEVIAVVDPVTEVVEKLDTPAVEVVPVVENVPVRQIDTIVILQTGDDGYEKELLASVEQSRLELAKVTQQYNHLIINQEADKGKLDAVNQKLDSLQMAFQNYQQYNNKVNIQGNTNAEKPENVAIQGSTGQLQKEIDYLKAQLILANKKDEAAVNNAMAKQYETERKVAQLENQVTELKKEVKKAKKAKRRRLSLKNFKLNRSRDKKKEEKNTEAVVEEAAPVIEKPVEAVVEVPAKKDTVYIEKPVEPVVEKPAVTVIEKEPKVIIVDNSGAKIDSVKTILKAEQEAALLKKQAEIEALKKRLESMETNVDASKKSEEKALGLLKNQMDSMNAKLSAMENAKPKTVIIKEEVKPVIDNKTRINMAIRGYETSSVYFKVGKSVIDVEFQNRLQQVASLMLIHPELRASVTGFTDKSGNPAVNLRLSKRRANAVKDFLMREGVRPDRLILNYQGDSNATKANDPYARKVDIVLIH